MYILFGFDKYYPAGGFKEILGIFASLDAAKNVENPEYDAYEIIATSDTWIECYLVGSRVSKTGRTFDTENVVTWERAIGAIRKNIHLNLE